MTTPDERVRGIQRVWSAGSYANVGDLVDLPLDDGEFDVVTSTFGAFTADDPHRCAAELVRVCRPGGTIATTAWGAGRCAT